MSRYSSRYSDSESDMDIHISRRHASPARPVRAPVQYVEAPRRARYDDRDRFLMPQHTERTVVTARSKSRDRRRRDSSPLSPPPPPAAPPVIINNHIINYSDSDSDSSDDGRHRHHQEVVRHTKVVRERADSSSSSYYRERDSRRHDVEREVERELARTRKDDELERARKELAELKLVAKIEEDDRRRDKTAKEERELRHMKKELEEIRQAKEREENERRLKTKLEVERLRKEDEERVEKQRLEKQARDAVEKYKKDEAARIAKEREEKEQRDKEYKQRLQEQLLKSGLDEKEINAIIAGKKVEKKEEKKKEKEDNRPTYTRMARRHLSIETLRVYNVDYQMDNVSYCPSSSVSEGKSHDTYRKAYLLKHDANHISPLQDPEYILIKRWVPDAEQDILWRHTRIIREERNRKLIMTIEDKPKKHKHHHHGAALEPEFEWVRKKERKRSRSPGLLMYLAGGRPA
ncbi:hypothetical protein G7054_g15026 [Neopestalotiopsis clavispora]|nr:hypothetical protein G7054_g15026 [Neopestalotiopsis clavispora]